MKRWIFKLIIVVATVLLALVAVLSQIYFGGAWCGVVTVVYIGIITACHFFLRCPNCGRWPSRGSFWAKYCPRCGHELDEETMF